MAGTSAAKRPRYDQDKTTPNENELEQTISLKKVLDYSRFFSNERQMKPYLIDFAGRTVVEPKIMDFEFFESNGFEFSNLLKYQGLDLFVSLSGTYFPDLVKVFYGNLSISKSGDLCSEVKNVKIRVKPRDWLSVSHLKYQGHKLDVSNMEVWGDYKRDVALVSMVRPGEEVCNSAGNLTVNDRLLHYAYVHILCPRGSNYSQLTNEDIFVMWAIKRQIHINWPNYICQHMMKCKAKRRMPLPYAILISKILEHHGINLVGEAECTPGWASKLKKRSLKKLNIKNVDGIWQIGDEGVNEQQQQEEEARSQGEEGDAPEVTPGDDILSCIFSAIQGLQQNLMITMQNLEKKVDNKLDELAKKIEDLEQLYRHRQST